jgi:hypothetical protein
MNKFNDFDNMKYYNISVFKKIMEDKKWIVNVKLKLKMKRMKQKSK